MKREVYRFTDCNNTDSSSFSMDRPRGQRVRSQSSLHLWVSFVLASFSISFLSDGGPSKPTVGTTLYPIILWIEKAHFSKISSKHPRTDSHWTALGHVLISEPITEIREELYWLPGRSEWLAYSWSLKVGVEGWGAGQTCTRTSD